MMQSQKNIMNSSPSQMDDFAIRKRHININAFASKVGAIHNPAPLAGFPARFRETKNGDCRPTTARFVRIR